MNILKIALQFQIRNKKNIFNIIFVIICLLLVMGFRSYGLSAKNYVKNYSNESTILKKLDVSIGARSTEEETISIDTSKYGTTVDFNEILKENGINKNDEILEENENIQNEEKIYTLDELEEIRKELENIEHINHATNWFTYFTYLHSKDFETKKLNGIVNIYTANNKTLPKIVLGTNFPDDEGNYIICPENFYPIESIEYKKLSSSSKLNIKKYLDKEITFDYSSNFQTNDYKTKYKLIGFYKNSTNEFDENVCYITHGAFKKLAIDMYSDDLDSENQTNNIVYQTGFVVQIDSTKNLNYVQNKLSELGYSSNPMLTRDSSGLNNLLKNTFKNSILIMFVTFIILVIVIQKEMDESEDNYHLLSFLGYKKKKVLLIYFISTIMQSLISIIFSVVISIVLFNLLYVIIKFYPFIINKWDLCIDYSSILYISMLVIIASIISFIKKYLEFGRNI